MDRSIWRRSERKRRKQMVLRMTMIRNMVTMAIMEMKVMARRTIMETRQVVHLSELPLVCHSTRRRCQLACKVQASTKTCS